MYSSTDEIARLKDELAKARAEIARLESEAAQRSKAETEQREKHIAVINALGRVFRAIYRLDLATGEFEAIVVAPDKRETMPLAGRAADWSAMLLDNFPPQRADFADELRSLFDFSTILARLEKTDPLSYDLQLADNRWIRVLAASLNDEDNILLVVGDVTEIKGQEIDFLRRIRASNQRLAADLAAQRKQLRIIESLSRIYFYTAYIDLKTQMLEEITSMDYITERLGKNVKLDQVVAAFVGEMVEPKYRAAMEAFMDFETLPSRLENVQSVSCEYVSIYIGWCRANFIATGRSKSGSLTSCIFALQSIAAEKEHEDSLLSTISDYSQKAYIDTLTNVYNRRYFEEHSAELAGYYAIAMLDIDKFKDTSISFGSNACDLYLRELASAASRHLRRDDVIIRHGDDEFIIAFLEGEEDDIRQIAEGIRKSAEGIRLSEYPALKATVSIGVAFRNNTANMFLSADRMLYRAKQRRNCVAV